MISHPRISLATSFGSAFQRFLSFIIVIFAVPTKTARSRLTTKSILSLKEFPREGAPRQKDDTLCWNASGPPREEGKHSEKDLFFREPQGTIPFLSLNTIIFDAC